MARKARQVKVAEDSIPRFDSGLPVFLSVVQDKTGPRLRLQFFVEEVPHNGLPAPVMESDEFHPFYIASDGGPKSEQFRKTGIRSCC